MKFESLTSVYLTYICGDKMTVISDCVISDLYEVS
jgi:hypothetical protein